MIVDMSDRERVIFNMRMKFWVNWLVLEIYDDFKYKNYVLLILGYHFIKFSYLKLNFKTKVLIWKIL